MSDSPYHPDNMRARFDELRARREEIASTSPRIERDARIDDLTEAQQRDFAARIKAHEADLYDIDVEIGVLARALGAKRG
jgi:hypothetical protein